MVCSGCRERPRELRSYSCWFVPDVTRGWGGSNQYPWFVLDVVTRQGEAKKFRRIEALIHGTRGITLPREDETFFWRHLAVNSRDTWDHAPTGVDFTSMGRYKRLDLP